MTVVHARQNHYDDVIAGLEAITPRRTQKDQQQGRCPAHEDDTPSLSWKIGDDGRILIHCHVGCSPEAIVAALGFELADLFPESSTRPTVVPDPVFGHRRAPAAPGERWFSATYTDGTTAPAVHRRTDDGTGGKRIWWDPAEAIEMERLAFYGADRLEPDQTSLHIVEGERATNFLRGPKPRLDADPSQDPGFFPTVGTWGKGWRPSDAAVDVCRGKHVYLWPDNDQGGRRAMLELAERLIGVALDVHVVDPPLDAEPGWDVADASAPELVFDLVRQASPFAAQRENPVGSGRILPFRTGRELVAAEEAATWSYIVRPWLVRGMISELDGKPKLAGKTTFIHHLIRCVLEGRPFLGEEVLEQGPVVLLTEQSRQLMRPTLAMLGLARDDLIVLCRPDIFAVPWLEIVGETREVCRHEGAIALFTDTIAPWVGISGDQENAAGVAQDAMQPLQQAATEDDLAILVSRHDRKGGGEVAESGRGSNAWSAAMDLVAVIRRPLNPIRGTIREIEAISRRGDVPGEPFYAELVDDEYVGLGLDPAIALKEAYGGLERLLADGKPRTEAEIREELRVSHGTFERARDAMVEAGRLTRIDPPQRNKPVLYQFAAQPLAGRVPLAAHRMGLGSERATPDSVGDRLAEILDQEEPL